MPRVPRRNTRAGPLDEVRPASYHVVWSLSTTVVPREFSSVMGLMFPVYTVPVPGLVFVAWAVATRRWPAVCGGSRWWLRSCWPPVSDPLAIRRGDPRLASRSDLALDRNRRGTAVERLSPLPGRRASPTARGWPPPRGRRRPTTDHLRLPGPAGQPPSSPAACLREVRRNVALGREPSPGRIPRVGRTPQPSRPHVQPIMRSSV